MMCVVFRGFVAVGLLAYVSWPGASVLAEQSLGAGTSPAVLKARLDTLRREYAPFLESRPPALDVRRRQTLSGDDWLCRFEATGVTDPAVRNEAPDWHRAGLDVAHWEATTVPEWRYEAAEHRKPVSCILWYRKTFSAGTPLAGQRVFLVFEGVDWEAEVWLNGRKLGSHCVYFEPFRFDVSDLLQEENTLAVRVIDGPVFGEPAAYWALFPVPPAEQQSYVHDRSRSLAGLSNGDTHIGSGFGIHRDVYLGTTGPAAVVEVLARGYPARNEAVVHVRVDALEAAPATIKVDLLPENFDGPAFHGVAPCKPDAAGLQTLAVPAPDARPWAPDAPHLYRCRVTLADGHEQILDVTDTLFGFRTIELANDLNPRDGMQPGGLLLDGRPLFLRGANIQGLNALWYWGENETLLDALLMLKAAHFNAVRSCQHVMFPEVLELLDRLGIMSQQDVGSRYPHLGEQTRAGLLAASVAAAHQCYNHPGVVLVSFANETDFDPTDMLRAARAIDPERVFVPISGHRNPSHQDFRNKDAWKGHLPDRLRRYALASAHPYWGWYGRLTIPEICQPVTNPWPLQIGEYGSEALDSYETMTRNYPEHWPPAPPKHADALWGHVQVTKDNAKQIVGFRGRKPSNLGEYITASQNYQYDQLIELTKAWRLSPQYVAGYFMFHFIDVLPANWPKSIVSHDLTPKRAYFGMAQINQPLVPLPHVLPGGQAMELWAANDRPEALPDSRIRWRVSHQGAALAGGQQPVDVPASGAVRAGMVDLAGVPADTDVVELSLTLQDARGRTLACFVQEVYLAAWRAHDNVRTNAPRERGQ